MPENRRVLIIEDSPTQAFRLRSLLEGAGIQSLVAPSGEAALDLLETTRPDAIVLDYHLPGMNGDALCRRLKQNVNTRAIPVLMLTVEHSDSAQMRGLESGADDYLRKSSDPEILLMRVRNLLRRSEGGEPVVDTRNAFNRARILAVDDSPTWLRFLEQELKAERCEVKLASTGRAGLEMVQNEDFDCVLVDFEMPDMNGAEFCRRISHLRREQGRELVVAMLTSHDDKEHQTLALEADADDYITQSADIEVIKARIRALLRRRFFIEENRRIIDELRERELDAARARGEKAAAEERAKLADQLAAANLELEGANRKLAEALDVTRAITENAAEALITVDRAGLVSFVNPAAAMMSGYLPEELSGGRLDDKLKLAGDDDLLPLCLATGTTITGRDGVFFRRDGTTVDIVCSFAPIARQGDVYAAVLVLHDVSERKRAEERLRHTQKLESIGLLAGGIAHDFNNLLTGILGNANLAQEMIPPRSEAGPLLDEIVSASERAAHLTRQMLAYSGKGHFVVEPLDLSALTRDMLKLLQTSIPRTVTMRLELADDLPRVEADAGQMQQVMLNLVVNAAEAIGDTSGTVIVSTGVHALTSTETERPGDYVYLEVRDTGVGMDKATKSKIFDPFFSTKFTGRGLGLAAVDGIVRGHRGAIVVNSKPGSGSTFRVLLPATAKRAAVVPHPSENHVHEGGVILVVDDDELVLRIATLSLSRHGFTVMQAASGPAALDTLRREQHRIDLVVLDLGMPGMSGLQVLAEIRKVKPDVQVIVSSGQSEGEMRRLFSGQRVSGFLQKPYAPAKIAQDVKAAIAGPQVRR